jgi:hypothetical protein
MTAATDGSALSVLMIGAESAQRLPALEGRFARFELLQLPGDPERDLRAAGREINRIVDDAISPWILILRNGERVSERLAEEIALAVGPSPRAWGFRIRSRLTYGGRPLLIGRAGEGEIRLFHRRHARLGAEASAREMKVQGSVVRLRSGLERELYSDSRSHLADLEQRGRRVTASIRLFRFLRRAVEEGAWRSPATLRFLWIEARFDSEQ